VKQLQQVVARRRGRLY